MRLCTTVRAIVANRRVGRQCRLYRSDLIFSRFNIRQGASNLDREIIISTFWALN